MQRRTKIGTGISGLDEILGGGLIPQKAYLLRGGPGTGKSTIGFHFLQQAAKDEEETLYITLGESAESIQQNAVNIGIDLDHVHFLDLTPSENLADGAHDYSVFSSSEVEQKPLIDSIIEAVETHKPQRVVFDSITMLRLLKKDKFQYRSLGLSLIKFICGSGATLILISESTKNSQEIDATFWVDGIITVSYSPDWRKISVQKYRGSDFMHGSHSFKITDDGTIVFPRLQPSKYDRKYTPGQLSSGIAEFDELSHGGIEKGTTTLVTGPTGIGKTNLCTQFLKEAAARDERSVIYTFEESKELILQRSKGINIPIDKMIETGNLSIVPIEPLSYSPDEFLHIVRKDVEEEGTSMVMIDSMGGYSMAVREDSALERLHALTVYLQNMGVTLFLTNESQSLVGDFSATGMHASYLADNIIFMRYIEVRGELQKAIGILKKRLSDFEKSIRSFQITSDGIQVGKPLDNLKGILSGLPEIIDQ